jgi:hypothetical protein
MSPSTHLAARTTGERSLHLVTAVTLLASGFALPFLLLFAIDGWRSLWPVTGAVAALGAAAAVARCRFLWREWGYAARAAALAGGYALALAAGAVAFFEALIVADSAELCGTDRELAEILASVAGGLAYLGFGSWALLRPGRTWWGWPVAVALGFTCLLLVAAVVPGDRSPCFG